MRRHLPRRVSNLRVLCRILTLLNKRQLEKLKEKWWNGNPAAAVCDKKDDQSDGISIQNIGGVFIVIFVGIGLACITLAFEYWWYKYRKGSKIIDVREAPTKGKGSMSKRPDPDMTVGFRPRQVYPPGAAATNFRPRF